MQTSILTLTLARAAADLRRADRSMALPTWLMRAIGSVASALIAKRLHRLAQTLADDGLRVLDLARMVERLSDTENEAIDPDGALAAEFAGMLVGIDRLSAHGDEMMRLAGRVRSDRLADAARQLLAVGAEFREAVAGLAWAVAENDASHAPRMSGYVAASPEEIGAMLDRIAAGE